MDEVDKVNTTGSIAWHLIEEILPVIIPKLGFFQRRALEGEIQSIKEYLLTATPEEEREIEVVLVRVRDMLNTELGEEKHG